MTTFDEYTAALALYMQRQVPDLTDLLPGSVARSLIEALGSQLEGLWYASAEGVATAINESAYRTWSFDRLPAAYATGTVRYTSTGVIGADITIPYGTVVRVPGTTKNYLVTVANVFTAGTAGRTLVVQIRSATPGALSNTSALTINEQAAPLAGLSVTNPQALTSGADVESDAARAARYATYLRSLHRGTADALAYGVTQAVVLDVSGVVIERVLDASLVDGSAGTATCYIANAANSAPSAGLITAAQAQVALYKAAGVLVTTTAATLTTQAVTVSTTKLAGVTLAAISGTIKQAITDYFATIGIGDVVYRTKIQQAVMGVPGVADCNVTVPSANVTPAASARVILGTQTVT